MGQAVDVRRHGDVDDMDPGPPAGVLDGPERALGALAVQFGDLHQGPVTGEQPRHRFPDATTASGDHGHPVLE